MNKNTFIVKNVQFMGITLEDENGNLYAVLGNKYQLQVGDKIEATYENTVIGIENGLTYQHINIKEKEDIYGRY